MSGRSAQSEASRYLPGRPSAQILTEERMRLFLGCMLAVALALSPAVAGANDSRSGGSGDAKASDAYSNSTSEAAATPDASAEPAPSAPTSGSGTATASARIPAAPASQAAQANNAVPASPLQFRLGSAFFTPIGFMDFTAVIRNHNAGGGIGSNFAAIPYEFPT